MQTRSASAAGRPILGHSGAVLTTTAVTVSNVTTTAASILTSTSNIMTTAHNVPLTTHSVITGATNAPPSDLNIPATSALSSAAPPLPSGIQEASNSFNTSLWSHGSVASPSYSVLTGLQKLQSRPGIPPADPVVSAGVKEIINSAIALSQLQYRQQEEERLRALIPRIAEATRCSLIMGNDPGNNLFPPSHLTMSAATHAPDRSSLESAIVTSAALASGLRAQHSHVAMGHPPPLSQQSNFGYPPVPMVNPQQPVTSVPVSAFNQPPPNLAVPPPNFALHSARSTQPPERLPNSYNIRQPGNLRAEPSGRCNLEKWGVRFDGTDKTMNVQEFIFREGALMKDYNCPEEEFVTKFHQLLDPPALDWYWNSRKFMPFRTWREIERALLMQYQRFENEFQIQMQILNRRQLPQETFDEFYNAVLKLRTQQETPYKEQEMVEIMRGNLKPALAQMIFSAQIQDLGEFYRQVKRAETLIASHRQQRYAVPQRVHELDWQQNEEFSAEPMHLQAQQHHIVQTQQQQVHIQHQHLQQRQQPVAQHFQPLLSEHTNRHYVQIQQQPISHHIQHQQSQQHQQPVALHFQPQLSQHTNHHFIEIQQQPVLHHIQQQQEEQNHQSNLNLRQSKDSDRVTGVESSYENEENDEPMHLQAQQHHIVQAHLQQVHIQHQHLQQHQQPVAQHFQPLLSEHTNRHYVQIQQQPVSHHIQHQQSQQHQQPVALHFQPQLSQHTNHHFIEIQQQPVLHHIQQQQEEQNHQSNLNLRQSKDSDRVTGVESSYENEENDEPMHLQAQQHHIVQTHQQQVHIQHQHLQQRQQPVAQHFQPQLSEHTNRHYVQIQQQPVSHHIQHQQSQQHEQPVALHFQPQLSQHTNHHFIEIQQQPVLHHIQQQQEEQNHQSNLNLRQSKDSDRVTGVESSHENEENYEGGTS
ncbi:uncharacterized protein LOC131806262 [Musca domestica]|uniref:Uncharacterized protein LOC131806262 n=1 Tax=Musca domestica TaxID=7370 RepID=A0ABM3VK78_MUSDO|nr:uncharacterized protein LOC131806262 [Musca domestica]